jgi:hypothetical protein
LPINPEKYNRHIQQLQKISIEIFADIVNIMFLGISERYSYEERYTSKV